MNQTFNIVEKDSFRVLGYALKTTNKRNEGRKAIPAHWATFARDNLEETLMPLNNQEPQALLGISAYNTDKTDACKFEYFIAVSSNESERDSLTEYVVPANTWAVFPCTVETIGKTEVQAITKWLPKSNYKPLNSGYITGRMKSGAPDIEYYGKDGLVEVWVAVQKK